MCDFLCSINRIINAFKVIWEQFLWFRFANLFKNEHVHGHDCDSDNESSLLRYQIDGNNSSEDELHHPDTI